MLDATEDPRTEGAAAEGPWRRVTCWRVHLGAHKTATTHLQEALRPRRAALRRAGVDYLPMPGVRAAGLQDLRRETEGAGRAARRRALTDRLRGLRRGGATVALSEENLIGSSLGLLGPEPYPTCGPMIRWLALLGEGAELRLFLAIRSFDALLPSAYAEASRRHAVPGGFERVRARAAAEPPSWAGLIDRLRRAAPKAELRVWRYEDYAAHAREAATLFLGLDPGPLDMDRRPQSTATPSAAAVAEAERLPTGLSTAEREARTREIYARLPATGPETKFNPFTAPERARLRDRYARDLEEIDRAHPGVLVRWD